MESANRVRWELPRASASSVHIDLLWSPLGPDYDPTKSDDARKIAEGSGFLFRVDDRDYLATARHNLSGRHWQTSACLGDPPVEPTHLRVAFLSEPGPEGWSVSPVATESGRAVGSLQISMPVFVFPLVGEDWQPLWLQHADFGARMDVAVLPVGGSPVDALRVPWESPRKAEGANTWPDLAAGDDVFIAGYPYGLDQGPMLPLWIRGTIASEPALGFRVDGVALPLMIIDARTRTGQSGSAVLRRRPAGTPLIKDNALQGFTAAPQSEIVGVYSGRTSDESDLGYVWMIGEVERICVDGVPGTTFE